MTQLIIACLKPLAGYFFLSFATNLIQKRQIKIQTPARRGRKGGIIFHKLFSKPLSLSFSKYVARKIILEMCGFCDVLNMV